MNLAHKQGSSSTYVVGVEVGMRALDSVVEDGDDDAGTVVSCLPRVRHPHAGVTVVVAGGGCHVQRRIVRCVVAMLREKDKSDKIQLSFLNFYQFL